MHGGGLKCSGGFKHSQANQFNVAGAFPKAPTMARVSQVAQIKFISWEATKHIQNTGQRRSKQKPQTSSLAAAALARYHYCCAFLAAPAFLGTLETASHSFEKLLHTAVGEINALIRTPFRVMTLKPIPWKADKSEAFSKV